MPLLGGSPFLGLALSFEDKNWACGVSEALLIRPAPNYTQPSPVFPATKLSKHN